MQNLVLDYDTLSAQQEKEFLFALHSDRGLGSTGVDESIDVHAFDFRLINVILRCQERVRGLGLWRVHVSIRDLMRAIKLYCTLIQVCVVILFSYFKFAVMSSVYLMNLNT